MGSGLSKSNGANTPRSGGRVMGKYPGPRSFRILRTSQGGVSSIDLQAKAAAEDWVNQSVGATGMLVSALLQHFELDSPEEGSSEKMAGGKEFFDALMTCTTQDLNTICSAFTAKIRDKVEATVDELKKKQRTERKSAKVEPLTSKFDVNDGDESDGSKHAAFGALADFYSGLDGRIGIPHPRVWEAMEIEHLRAPNAHDPFTSSNYGGINTYPALEWEFACRPDPWKTYPCDKYRKPQELQTFLGKQEVTEANLTREEVLALRLYTGPMFFVYNTVLRKTPESLYQKLKGNRYITTIHTIVSAIIKLSRICRLPRDRKVFRGISGVTLPERFWTPDIYGCCGGVEVAIMSCTTKREVAVQYSFYRGTVATLMEIEVGQVDRGASLSWVSQFPAEDEIVMPPLSNLEIVGRPRMELTELGRILVVPMRVNVNIKSLTLEELISRRQFLHLQMLKTLKDECRLLVKSTQISAKHAEIEETLAEFSTQSLINRRKDPQWFNMDDHYRESINSALDLKIGFERKWDLMHDEEIKQDEDLLKRIMTSASLSFADEGFLWVLRSGTETVPWGSLIRGLDTCRLGPLPLYQVKIVWECFVQYSSSLRTLQVENDDKQMIELDLETLLEGDKIDLKDKKLGRSLLLILPTFLLNQNLISLNFRGNCLGDEGATTLSEVLGKCKSLTSLDLGDNSIGPDGGVVIAEQLANLTLLKSLNLTMNPLDDPGVKAVSKAIPSMPNLTSLDLSWIQFGTQATIAVAKALQKLQTIANVEFFPGYFKSKLDTESIWDDDALVARELSACLARQKNLKSATMSGFQSDLIGQSLCDALTQAKAMEVLFMACNFGSFEGASALADVILKHTSLKVFGIGWDYIHESTLSALVQNKENVSYNMLLLLSCRFNSGSLKKLAEILSKSGLELGTFMLPNPILETGRFEDFLSQVTFPTNLKTLDLGHCGMTEAMGQDLGKSLRCCSSLTLLNLNNNKIGATGATALSEVLVHNQGLTDLNLSGNDMLPAGAQAICQSLQNCTLLKKLDLSANGLEEDGCLELVTVLQNCTGLQSLFLQSNRILAGKQGEHPSKVMRFWNLLSCEHVPASVDLSGNPFDSFTANQFKGVFSNANRQRYNSSRASSSSSDSRSQLSSRSSESRSQLS